MEEIIKKPISEGRVMFFVILVIIQTLLFVVFQNQIEEDWGGLLALPIMGIGSIASIVGIFSATSSLMRNKTSILTIMILITSALSFIYYTIVF